MTKINGNIFTTMAKGIHDFSCHKVNRVELFDLICSCISESTDKDKEEISNTENIGNNVKFSREWLMKK